MIRRSPRSRSSVYKRGNGRIVGDYEDATSKKRHVSGKTKPDVLHKLCKLLEDRRPGRTLPAEARRRIVRSTYPLHTHDHTQSAR
jgi:hypothetical protein